MNLAHYAFSDRIFLLVLSQYIALVIGGPRFFHTIIGYELPAHLWRVAILGAEKRLNRLNRPPADRKARGRLVVWGGSALLLAIGRLVRDSDQSVALWMVCGTGSSGVPDSIAGGHFAGYGNSLGLSPEALCRHLSFAGTFNGQGRGAARRVWIDTW